MALQIEMNFKACLVLLALINLKQVAMCRGQTAYCSSSLQRLSVDDGGQIASHSEIGVANYSNNLQCYWELSSAPGSRIIAWFSYIDLEVPNDIVTLYDGLVTSPVIAAVSQSDSTGYISPKFVSTQNVMTVYFYTNNKDANKGFRLQYNATNTSSSGYCMPISFDSISNSSGSIVSHLGYDQSTLYASNMSCRWTLPAVSGQFVQLTVGNFSIATVDCLTITRGRTGGSNNLNLCGWKADTQLVLQMDGNIQITFTSNGALVSSGFIIKFEYKDYCQENQNFTSSPGEIVSHTGLQFSLSYWLGMRCSWYIVAPPGQQIWMWFTYFSLSYPYPYDTVYIDDAGGPTLANIPGHSSPSTAGYQSTTNIVNVKFFTYNYASPGFRLQYNFTKLYCYGFENLNATGTTDRIVSHTRVSSIIYLNNMDCYWRLNAPTGQRVAAWLQHTSIESKDKLTLYDGVNGSNVITTINGQSSVIFVSTSSIMTARFNTDSSGAGTGFILAFKAVPSSAGCGVINFTSTFSGVINSHIGYDPVEISAYAANLNCLWNLPRRPGYYIYAFIRTFYISSGDCLRLSTKFTDTVATPGSDTDVQYCGWNAGGLSWVTTGDAQITFTSDSQFESTGFVIQFYYEQACPSVQQWNADNGEVLSQTNAGRTHYLNSLVCNWQISVSPGKQVIAWFTHSSMHWSDPVTLFDGLTGATTLVSTHGPPLNSGYRSSSNFMRVRFTADTGAFTHYTGFRLRYSITENFCSGRRTLTGDSGEISSHNNASSPSYLTHMSCYWLIVAPPENNVIVQFTDFNISVYDNIYIDDGITGSRIATVSGSNSLVTASSWSLVSATNNMLVSFVSQSGQISAGFRITYTTTQRFCRNMQLLSSEAGEIWSHSSAGASRFAITSTCYWVISVPPSKRVLARFSLFNLTSSSESVFLYDGFVGSSVLSELYNTFSDTSRTFLTSENSMTIKLTIYSGRSLGFKLSYIATDSLCEKYKLISGGSGEISSHSGVGSSPYPNGLRCTWQIIGPSGAQVSANLAYFNLLTSADLITLQEGADNTAIVTVRGGVSSWPTRFLTLSNILTITFVSGNGGSGLGFRIQYSTGEILPAETSSTTRQTNSPPAISTSSVDLRASSAAASPFTTTASQPLQPEAQTTMPTYVLVLAIAIPAVLLVVGAIVIAVILHKRSLQQPQIPTGRVNSYKDGTLGTLPDDSTDPDGYLKADTSPSKAEEEYDYIGMEGQGADAKARHG